MDRPSVTKGAARFNHIDPRTKLVHALVAGALLFVVRSTEGILLNDAFMAAVLVFFGLYAQAAQLAAVSAALLLAFLALSGLTGGAAALGVSVYLFLKFTPAVGMYFVMTKTVSASELVNALEKLRLPRAVTITLAVTLRFMPTIGQEMKVIGDSMRIRNIPLTPWSVAKAPMTMLEFIMVPLMMRFVKVADELAAAAVVRGIERPGRRGSLLEVRLRLQDLAYLAAVGGTAALLFFFERGMFR